jgi:hypothetical protein
VITSSGVRLSVRRAANGIHDWRGIGCTASSRDDRYGMSVAEGEAITAETPIDVSFNGAIDPSPIHEMRRSSNPMRHCHKFCQRCARFRQASPQIGCACALFAQFELARQGTEIQRPCYLRKRDNLPSLSLTIVIVRRLRSLETSPHAGS